jgi:hypothetical protein
LTPYHASNANLELLERLVHSYMIQNWTWRKFKKEYEIEFISAKYCFMQFLKNGNEFTQYLVLHDQCGFERISAA